MNVPSHLHGIAVGGGSHHYNVSFPCDVCGLIASGSFYSPYPTVKVYVTNPPNSTTSGIVFVDEVGAPVHTITHYCTTPPPLIAHHDMANINYKLDNLIQWQTSFQSREDTWREQEARLKALTELLQDKVRWLLSDLETARKRIRELGG